MGKKIVILGGGPGGYTAAIRAAQLGGEVTLIEQDNLGGTCLNQGCIPSKFLKKTADILDAIHKADSFGIEVEGSPKLDLARHVEHQKQLVASQAAGIAKILKKNSITHIKGTGHIIDNNQIEITGNIEGFTFVQWDKLIIATGSSPLSIPAFPFDHQNILSSTDILNLQELPKSLAIVGGGVIGCEFASIFASFGTKVTIIEALDRLVPIPSLDSDISKTLLREMKKKKITVHTKNLVKSISEQDGELIVSFTDVKGKKEKSVTCKKVLVSIGRAPNTIGIGLEEVGIKTDQNGWILVDETMQTSVENVYAIGDVIGPEKVMLAHVAATEGEVAAENCFGSDHVMIYDTIPNGIFTSPEIGSVGLSEEQASKQHAEAASETVLFRSLGKAHASGEIAGTAKLVFDSSSGKILGVHIIGARATDILGEASLAIERGITVQQLAETIHAHPTYSEILLETAQKAIGLPVHG